MPSFYPRQSGRSQLPLTPPEYGAIYSSGNLPAMSFPYAQYVAHQRNAQAYSDLRDLDETREYPHFTSFANDAFGKMGPILPPPISTRPPTYDQAMTSAMNFQFRHDSRHVGEQQIQAKTEKPEKPVGGVSATLDYDMDIMTDFVTEMAHGIVQPHMNHGQASDPAWRKWVHQVLCATRLPSATILLSLQYLAMRMQQLSRNGDCSAQPSFQRQRMLTVAFILGSKFLDDNTFINRSWAEVSGIDVAVLNYMELDWFQAMDHCLHREPSEPQGFNTWQEHWKLFELNIRHHKANGLKLSPIDTTVQYPKPVRHSHSIPAFHSQSNFARLPLPTEPTRQYDAQAYGQYDPAWLYPHSATDSSPASASHTGPTTPEYYSSAGPVPAPWSGNGGYSRRTMFGFPPTQTVVPGMSATLTGPLQEPSIQFLQMYSGHATGCRCYQCCYSPPRNLVQGYPSLSQPLPVAG